MGEDDAKKRRAGEGVEVAEDGAVGGHAVPPLAGHGGAREGRLVREAEEDLSKEVVADGRHGGRHLALRLLAAAIAVR